MTPMAGVDQPRIVVTGASGKVGRMIAETLAGRRVSQTLLVRDPARAPDLPGSAVAVADFTDGAAVRAALRPGDRVFMVSVHEDVETRIAAHRSFIDAAADVGVGLLAYLSIVQPSPTASFRHSRSHDATERMIRASDVPSTFLRMNLFLEELPLWFDQDGVCRGPGGDGRVSLITRADTAAVSAAVVRGPGYEDEALDVTGEESHSLAELAALCSEILGRPFRYEPGTREAWIDSRLAAGIPAWDANIGVGSYEGLDRGEFDVTSGVVRRITGAPPQSVRSWVEAHPERFARLGADARHARTSG